MSADHNASLMPGKNASAMALTSLAIRLRLGVSDRLFVYLG
jgi:hypothetical protein